MKSGNSFFLREGCAMAQDKNIFETASKQLGKKNKKNTQDKAKPKPVTPASPMNLETKAIMAQINEMHQDLQAKVQYIESKCDLLGPGLANYIKEKKEFTPEELSFIEKSKGLLGEKIWGLLGKPSKSPIEPSPAPAPSPASPANRKHKTLGVRKKWMPVK
jgi:hypothetical protein